MRIRSIKPDFWTSLTIADLTFGARLTFIGMWNVADDEGRGVADPRAIKAKLWALDDVVTSSQVQGWLGEIEGKGLITLYQAEGKPLFQVNSWREHQVVNRPTPSSIPPPEGLTEDSLSTHGGLTGEGRNEGRMEGRSTITDSSVSTPGVIRETKGKVVV